MSRISIKGASTGTATFTIESPATDTNRTLVLPDVDGTIITGTGGVTAVAQGGTGAASLTANNVLLGNGTSALQTVAAGTAGNVLTSNGTTWTSAAISAGGDYVMQTFTAPGTWTKPAGLKAVKVTVVGGGGGTATSPGPTGPSVPAGAGGGGAAIRYIPAPSIPGPVTVTRGAGGGVGAAGGTSSFGPFASATGGGGAALGPFTTRGAGGAGSSGDLNISGETGSIGSPSSGALSGKGGNSILGFGGIGNGFAPESNFNGVPGAIYGGGAGGIYKTQPLTTVTGGSGGNGVVIVEEFY
jgi:hypothetical protein